MKIVKLLAVAGVIALSPLAAQSEGLSYSYLEGGFAQLDVDGVSSKLDGYYLRGSVGFAEHFFAAADYLDASKSGLDAQIYSVVLGGHFPLSDQVDLIGRAGYAGSEAGEYGYNASDDGYVVGAGLRGRLAEHFELEGNVNYYDFSDSGNDTVIGVAARYYFTDQFALGADYQHFDGADLWGLGVRWSFGK
jgi:hypothetical protein